MIEIKGPFNPYIYGEISRESFRERIGNQECTDMFVIHADKTRKLMYMDVFMYMDETVKKAQSSTKAAENSCARKMKTRTR